MSTSVWNCGLCMGLHSRGSRGRRRGGSVADFAINNDRLAKPSRVATTRPVREAGNEAKGVRGGADGVLSVQALRKQYGETVAVGGVSFEVGRGEIVGLLGPNGAGKTTTINMVLGVLEPSAGRILIEGVDLGAHRSR